MMQNVKPLIVKDDETGIEYTLEFNREAIRFAEARGFKINDVGDFPMSKVPELWYYAFRMHHKNVARAKTDALLDGLGGVPAVLETPGLMERLGELYAAPFNTMTDEGGANPPTVTIKM